MLITGLFLLAFTTTTFTAIQLASVSAVMAIGAAAPVITTVLQVGIVGQLNLSAPDIAGSAVTLLAVVAFVILGVRRSTALSD